MTYAQLTARARAILSRRYSYRAVFTPANDATGAGKAVLKDLAKYCRAYESTVMVGQSGYDSHASAVAQGRREVWLRIQSMLELPDKHLLNDVENDDD